LYCVRSTSIVDIFYLVDEFCKEFDKVKEGHVLQKDCAKKSRKRQFRMSDSEVITIMIYFHLNQFRNIKHFYINYIQKYCQEYFPDTVSYNRFVELQQKAVLPMAVFLKMCCLGKCTGISFIDSTSIQVCHTCTAYKVRGIKREHSHKTFKGLAAKGAWLQTAYRHQRQGRNIGFCYFSSKYR